MDPESAIDARAAQARGVSGTIIQSLPVTFLGRPDPFWTCFLTCPPRRTD
jgi:hypothetical protein